MSGKEWWRPETFARRRPALLARARVLAALRAFFAGRGFVEVETPCLQRSPGLEPHIMALATELAEPFGTGKQRLYLHTSPEFSMKKLLVAGMPKIFQIAHVWRDGERSPTHHPEFSMLEWYRADAGYEALMADCADILALAARAAGTRELRRGERRCDPFAPPKRLSVAQAFFDYCDIDLFATTADPWTPDTVRLAGEARRLGLHVGETDSWRMSSSRS